MTMKAKKFFSSQQFKIASGLHRDHGIDPSRVLFLNPERPAEPWIPPNELLEIARQSDRFSSVDEDFALYIRELNQIVHRATVIDQNGRSFIRSGVAMIGETSPAGEAIDPHVLAAGRAISAALTSAGLNPIKQGAGTQVAPEVESRRNDLKRIHMLAEAAGLRAGRDDRAYREWLQQCFGTRTAATLDERQRASAINALEQLVDEAAMI